MNNIIDLIKNDTFPTSAMFQASYIQPLLVLKEVMEDLCIGSVQIFADSRFDDNNYYTAYVFNTFKLDDKYSSADKDVLNKFAEGMRKHIYPEYALKDDDDCLQTILDDYLEGDCEFEFNEVVDAETLNNVFYWANDGITLELIEDEIQKRIEQDIPKLKAFFMRINEAA